MNSWLGLGKAWGRLGEGWGGDAVRITVHRQRWLHVCLLQATRTCWALSDLQFGLAVYKHNHILIITKQNLDHETPVTLWRGWEYHRRGPSSSTPVVDVIPMWSMALVVTKGLSNVRGLVFHSKKNQIRSRKSKRSTEDFSIFELTMMVTMMLSTGSVLNSRL